MKRSLPLLPCFLILTACAFSSDPKLNNLDTLQGTWVGESICTVRPSPCNDEKVVYHISKPDAAGKTTIQADKIVNGKPDHMGTLDCIFDVKASTLICPMNNGKWVFAVADKTMTGTLQLPDGTVYRKISVMKQD